MQQLNHWYRILATGFCFAVFGIGGVLLSLTVFPLQRLFIRDLEQRKRHARHTVHKAFKGFIALMRFVGIFNFNFTASAQLEQARGQIIIANHPSLIDVVALIAMTPQADCVVKAQLFSNPFMRGVITSTGYISNSDPDKLLDDCAASLNKGNNLIIFPEGTRSTPGSTLVFQRGAANIALRAKRGYLALYICCQPSTLTKQEKWYQVPAKKPTLSIKYLQDIQLTDYLERIQSPSLAARQLTRDLQYFYQQAVK
ncbi:lysophospholipid acyltransferase family protein [Rheinheimera salexigens]|uniref:Acyl-phosphate glycerol 3-phosphate acyltransferase n=1 Tax=Rheinheimera salexigens TaxID=1628148 RepID=A0A1E7Q9W8_9GAMM|nr:lysophospholipid acyltransferase family protein [Rheinheimera salexigens]OEY70891.1 acyl-phosphate glycerol 3-phosphate acyltransferase [Rheinheimera salexigens]